MKNKIIMLLITSGLLCSLNAEQIIKDKQIIVSETNHIKGILFDQIGVVVEKNSLLEKDLIDVLKKHNMIYPVEHNTIVFDKTLENIKNNELNINKPKIISDIQEIELNKDTEEENILGDEIVIDLKECMTCHGNDFEKTTILNKSIAVKDLTKEEILKALNGYKGGYYGGDNKYKMKDALSNYNYEDLKLISEQISKRTYKANLKDKE